MAEPEAAKLCDHGKENCRACGPDMDVLQRIEIAMQHVFDLCAKRKRFLMSVPVEHTDSDELLCRALRGAQLEIERLRGFEPCQHVYHVGTEAESFCDIQRHGHLAPVLNHTHLSGAFAAEVAERGERTCSCECGCAALVFEPLDDCSDCRGGKHA